MYNNLMFDSHVPVIFRIGILHMPYNVEWDWQNDKSHNLTFILHNNNYLSYTHFSYLRMYYLNHYNIPLY